MEFVRLIRDLVKSSRMSKWEYKDQTWIKEGKEQNFVEWLNESGTQGWELVQIIVRCGSMECMFKRELCANCEGVDEDERYRFGMNRD